MSLSPPHISGPSRFPLSEMAVVTARSCALRRVPASRVFGFLLVFLIIGAARMLRDWHSLTGSEHPSRSLSSN